MRSRTRRTGSLRRRKSSEHEEEEDLLRRSDRTCSTLYVVCDRHDNNCRKKKGVAVGTDDDGTKDCSLLCCT